MNRTAASGVLEIVDEMSRIAKRMHKIELHKRYTRKDIDEYTQLDSNLREVIEELTDAYSHNATDLTCAAIEMEYAIEERTGR